MARLEALIDVLDRSKKRIVIALGLAILLHLPATPVMVVLRLMHILKAQDTPPPSSAAPPPRQIEVELQEAFHQDQQRRDQQAPPEPPPNRQTLAMPTPPAPVNFAPGAATKEDDPENADKPKDPKKEKVKDIGLEGLVGKIASKPGVTLGLWLSSLRENPLGKRVTEIAACDREWKVFVDQGVDLINDFEGALVVGPALFEPKAMTVAVKHALTQQRVHEVVDGLVRRSGAHGKWLESDVATARLGKVQRILLPQQSDMFFVAPSKGWETLHNVKQPLRVPAGDGRLVSIALVPPQKVLARAGLSLPTRISELRLEAFANADASLDIRVELLDASPAAADQDVKRISRLLHDFFADVWAIAATLGALTGANQGDAPRELAPRLDLTVDERTLTGMIHLSPSQTKTTLELAASILCRKSKHSAQKASP